MLIDTDVTQRLLQQQPHLLPDSIRVEVQNAEAIVALQPLATSANIDWAGGRQQLLGRSVFPVRLLDKEGVQLGRYGAVTLVSAEAPLWETKRLMMQGEIVASEDLQMRVADAHGQPMSAVRRLESVVGQELVTNLPAGTVVTDAMVRGIPDVRRGALLIGVFERKALRFELKGEALSDAKIGQKIKMRLQIGSRRVVEGQVIDAKTVLVD